MKTMIYLMMALSSCSVNALAQDKINLPDLMGDHMPGNATLLFEKGFRLYTQQQQQQPNGPYTGCLDAEDWTKFIFKREVMFKNNTLVATDGMILLNSKMSTEMKERLAQLFQSKHIYLACTGGHSKPIYQYYDQQQQRQQDTTQDPECLEQCTLNGGSQSDCRQSCTVYVLAQARTPGFDTEKFACEARNVGAKYTDSIYQCSLQAE